jgi:cardiolipin synthase
MQTIDPGEKSGKNGSFARLLNNGDQTYSALIGALQRARRSIHLEYYIFDDDRIGQTIAEILIRRARGGVRVRIIYDLFGSWLPARGMLRRLRKAGVEVHPFRPLKWNKLWPGINIRNHRKIAIIDQRIAFLGGINIARRYLEGCELGRWRDEHLQLQGEAVEELERLFREDWLMVGGRSYPSSETTDPASPRIPRVRGVQIISSREGKSRRQIEEKLIRLIRSARHELYASTPYLIPPHNLRRALRCAVKRGVRVLLMIPSRVESRAVGWVAESFYEELLRDGVELYRYEKGFLHSKMMVSDRKFTYLGTANLDYRSLRINWEVGALIEDRNFGGDIARIFEEDLFNCSPLLLSNHRKRPWLRRLLNGLARPLAPLF